MKTFRVGVLFLLGLGASTIAKAATDVGAYYWVFKRADYVQTSTANPVPTSAPFHFTSFVQRAPGGSFANATSTILPPPTGVINTLRAYTRTGDGSLQYDTFFSQQAHLDNAFGSGGYQLNIRGNMAEHNPTLSLTPGTSSFPIEKPKLSNTNFVNGQLHVNAAVSNTLSWNLFASHDFVDDIVVLTITNGTTIILQNVLAPGVTSKAFAANFFKPEQNYVAELSFVNVRQKDTVKIPGSTAFTGFATTTKIHISTSTRTPINGLANLSTRGVVGTGGNVLISGFVISSTDTSKTRVIVRAIGPSLARFGIANPLQDPIIQLFDAQGHLIAVNDNWRTTATPSLITAANLQPSDDRESALLRDLSPGAYTAVMVGKNNTTGVGLTEVYNRGSTGQAKLINIATRGQVLINDEVMIAGMVAQGPFNHSYLFRVLGPTLTSRGVPGALADPVLRLVNAQGTLLALNDNWKDSQQAQIQATGRAPTNDNESAILRTLGPGAYTAIVRGKNMTTGVGLVEVYAQN